MQPLAEKNHLAQKFQIAGSLFRDEGIVAAFRHIRLALLRRLHFVVWDRRYEAFETFPTENLVLKDELAPTDAANLDNAREYIPSPRLIVHWLLEGLGEDLSKFSFVDFGAGRGRVLLTAAEKPFRSVTGVEFSSTLHGEAQANILNYPQDRISCTSVKSVCGDAVQWDVDDGENILYFYNPFGAAIVKKVVDRALAAAEANQTRLLIVYYNPAHHDILDAHPGLKSKKLPAGLRLKLWLMSPYTARVYESVTTI